LARGELDLVTAPALQSALQDLLDANVRHIVLDLRELEFIDSTGLRVVYWLDQLSRHDGFNAAIVRGRQGIQRVFTVAGLSDRLVFVDRPEDLAPPSS
jgi:anti-sigma B factor antagonist